MARTGFKARRRRALVAVGTLLAGVLAACASSDRAAPNAMTAARIPANNTACERFRMRIPQLLTIERLR